MNHRHTFLALSILLPALVIGALALEVVRTAPVRSAVRTYMSLIAAANRQDLATARALCSARYLRTHDLTPASDGGLVGLPRGIHKNFRAWRQDGSILLCPTNRVGPVYRFVSEAQAWKFDGPVGLLRADGRVERFGPVSRSSGIGPPPPS